MTTLCIPNGCPRSLDCSPLSRIDADVENNFPDLNLDAVLIAQQALLLGATMWFVGFAFQYI